mmetsp:Transcript_2879/g.10956  ORF Transcript_2879/g.10956 Transcript_2879/m.10956 type:complete len:234 (+) Transcript_2879:8757-9458(+)
MSTQFKIGPSNALHIRNHSNEDREYTYITFRSLDTARKNTKVFVESVILAPGRSVMCGTRQKDPSAKCFFWNIDMALQDTRKAGTVVVEHCPPRKLARGHPASRHPSQEQYQYVDEAEGRDRPISSSAASEEEGITDLENGTQGNHPRIFLGKGEVGSDTMVLDRMKNPLVDQENRGISGSFSVHFPQQASNDFVDPPNPHEQKSHPPHRMQVPDPYKCVKRSPLTKFSSNND